jgi:hypothetical protein
MEPVSTAYVMFLVISHMTVSSTMLILNKAVLVYLPVATSVLLAQVGSSAIILWVLGKMKCLDVDGFDLNSVILLSIHSSGLPVSSLPMVFIPIESGTGLFLECSGLYRRAVHQFQGARVS